MIKRVRLACPAKLNLFLEVEGRRPDGYHDLVTVMTPVDLADTLEVREARGFHLDVEGADLPGVNTVEKAYRAVARRRRIPGARVRLVKRIPAGSGLGGGSSDAAAMIEALDTLYALGLDAGEVGGEVGSDVNFFFARGPALCTGRGERVAPLLPAPRLHAVLAWPGFSLSTAAVYAGAARTLTGPRRNVIHFLNFFARGKADDLGPALYNRLESAAFALRPELDSLLRSLRRLPFSGVRMTGSGSAMYGLCPSPTEALRLARRLRTEFPGRVWTISTLPRGTPWTSLKCGSSS